MAKNLYIIATCFKDLTGGLIWTNRLAEYAKKHYRKTILIDLSRENIFLQKYKLFEIVHNLSFLLTLRNSFVFLDHRLHLRFGIPLLISSLITKNKYATICHHTFYPTKENSIRKAIEHLSEKLFLKNAQVVIVPSRTTSADMQKFRIDRAKVAIINPTYCFKGNKIVDKKQHKILFVGSLEPRIGLDVLIKSLVLI
jgi:glycosyltransferase involved in cell wall biosynthesis